MVVEDARSLPAEAKEALRRRAMHAVFERGLTHAEVAEVLGVARPTVSGWASAFRREGESAIMARPLGRPAGHTKLDGWQAAAVKAAVLAGGPDQLQLPGLLWTRDLVREYVLRRFDIDLSVETVGRYLKRWGLTVQKPSRRAFEQSDLEVARWLKVEFPRIQREARAEGALIYWCDEAGVRSDHQTGTSWGLKGVTPVVRRSGKRFQVNVISSVSARGDLRFSVFEGSFTQQVFIEYLRRLIKHSDRKLYVIVDNHVVHRGKLVRAWLDRHSDQIRLIRLPSYSPELNPDEMLNQDLKQHVGRTRAHSARDLTNRVRSFLRSRSWRPDIIAGYFTTPTTSYAA